MTTTYEHGIISGPNVILRTLADYVDYFARLNPGSEAVVFGQSRITYRRLKKDVEDCARALLAFGARKGDRVAMLCTSRPQFWTLLLAATRIGMIWVGLNPKYKRDELRYIVADCQPMIIFSLRQFEGREYTDVINALGEEFPRIKNIVSIEGTITGAVPFGKFLEKADSVSNESYSAAIRSVDSRDEALIVYTSGTTGNPKGAVLSHYGLTHGATMQTAHLRIEQPAVVVNFPINHVACIADSCATTLVKGGKIVFQERFDPAATLQAIEDERCSMMGGVPTMLQMMLGHPDFSRFDLSSVELVAWGGAAMPRDGIARLNDICPRLKQFYGLTESSANVVFGEEGASFDMLAESIGKPDEGVQCRIVDDSGDLCSVGSSGELQFRADFLFLGYWNKPEATRESFAPDGWLRTGDIGFWREDGNIELVGRKSEMFKSGGYNVYPREIEMVIESIPAVAMAAVIGVPDDLFQEVGHAFVLLEPENDISVEKLHSICNEKLANYKIPKQFSVRRNLPMLPVGKIDKQALKNAAAASLEKSCNTDSGQGNK